MYLTFMKSYKTIILIENEQYRTKRVIFYLLVLGELIFVSARFKGYVLGAGFC